MEFAVVILALVLFCIVIFLFFGFVITALEELYVRIFKRPFYIHCYYPKKDLTSGEESILRNEFPFYNKLTAQHKIYFRHRVFRFIERHTFIGKNDFIITDQVKILIAATATMLTFGMRKYLFEVIDKIIIYPEPYLSTITNESHKGEFNPRAKAVVFSWRDFIGGHQVNNDNLNLGLHEFSHVLHYHGSKYQDMSAINFSRMYRRITAEVLYKSNRDKLLQSDYFRIYAYTNPHEFLAVIIEHYFETPQTFKKEFPELYKKVELMLNHRHR